MLFGTSGTRVVRAGLDPYQTRPDDPAVQNVHSDVTRDVDAAWLPTLYAPVTQVYFLGVTAVHESIAAVPGRSTALRCGNSSPGRSSARSRDSMTGADKLSWTLWAS